MVELIEYGDMVRASDLSLTILLTLTISVPDLSNENERGLRMTQKPGCI